jgi:hypothetical protein
MGRFCGKQQFNDCSAKNAFFGLGILCKMLAATFCRFFTTADSPLHDLILTKAECKADMIELATVN